MAYVRKTRDEYALMADYGYGWEELYRVDTHREAREDLKAYRENERYADFKIAKKRVPLDK